VELLGQRVNVTTEGTTLDLFPRAGIWHVSPGGEVTTGIWPITPTVPITLRESTIRGFDETQGLLAGGMWRDGALRNSWIWVTSVPLARADQACHIHHWPAGNVYEDAHICWGAVQIRSTDASQFHVISDLFFSSPFNRDLVQAQTWQITESGIFRVMFENLYRGVDANDSVRQLLTRIVGH
jgi:hypothetical protein